MQACHDQHASKGIDRNKFDEYGRDEYVNVLAFFFFQAEDGIRDKLVTGVQTCALPICRRGPGGSLTMKRIAASLLAVGLLAAPVLAAETTPPATAPAAPATKAAGTTTKAPDGAKLAPAKTEPKSVAPATRRRGHKRHTTVTKPKAAPAAGRIAYHWRSFYPRFDAWLASTRARTATWGFNTAGASSLPPDVLALPVIPDLELGRTARFHWVDPFDPATEERMRAAARRLVAPYKGSPFRIGYFSDNEVGWWDGALFAFYLEQAATNHTKQRLVALLREVYGDDWDRFARDFVPPSGVASFADLLAREGGTPHLRPGGDGIQVVGRWTGMVAERYYRLVHDALRAADPDALVFGDRLPIYYDPAAVRAMAPWVDAIATNYNVDSPDGWIARYYFDGLRALSGGKPVLVSEWFFAANENRTGNRNNGHLMTVATQAERARGAAAAAARFAREPGVVGAHWFQYYDHPRGGRDDGGDYDFGLVGGGDPPYGQLVTALGRVNARLAAFHRAARVVSLRPRAELPEAPIDPRDRSLAEWPKERALVALRAPAPEVPFGDLYVAWSREGLSLAAIAMDYYAPELLPADQELPLDECFHVDWGIDAGHGPRRFALYVIPPRVRSAAGDYVMH